MQRTMKDLIMNMNKWGGSSVGRAGPLQGSGRGFDSLSLHHIDELRDKG